MSKFLTLIQGWRGDLSTGRVNAIIALGVAVAQEFRGAPIEHVALWLGAAFGSYGWAKGTEMICSRKAVGVEAPPAPGAGVPDASGADGGTT